MAETKTLLVVEDDSITREAVGAVLRREGYNVISAANGEEALDHLRSGLRLDLILLDMLMPVLDGWHFLQEIRAQGAPPIPIIVVTATILTRQWAEDHGCRGFVRKPIESDSLLAEIRRCLATDNR
jgi:CheY-like chemotaxis protein